MSADGFASNVQDIARFKLPFCVMYLSDNIETLLGLSKDKIDMYTCYRKLRTFFNCMYILLTRTGNELIRKYLMLRGKPWSRKVVSFWRTAFMTQLYLSSWLGRVAV